MASKNLFKDLSSSQVDLSSRIFGLVISRVLKGAYSGFDEKTKKEMDETFLSENDKEKEKFIRKNIPDFKKIFEEETKKFEEEIKAEIEILVAEPL